MTRADDIENAALRAMARIDRLSQHATVEHRADLQQVRALLAPVLIQPSPLRRPR